jgi:hypothetical protein
MEETDYLVRVGIDPGHIWTFEAIAMDARQSEVFKLGFATMLSRNDVIYREWRWMKCRGQVTVFATIPCALPDLSNEISVQNSLLSGTPLGAAPF